MRSPKIQVPQQDQQLVATQKADAARAQADRIAQIQNVLRGQTARTRRRYGVFDQAIAMLDVAGNNGGVGAVAPIAVAGLPGQAAMTGSGQRSGYGGGQKATGQAV